MRKQWIPGPFLSPREKGLGTRLEVSVVREAANRSAVRLGYSLGLKKEQMEVVVAFMTGNDVFAVLPTGFGKSLCYACLPLAFAELEKAERTGPIVVV